MLFAYFTPDVILPVASIFAGACGVIMMVGRAPFRFAARGVRAVLKYFNEPTPPPPPDAKS